ncbi:MAG: carboxymuconolactone decarboxylase family protein [Gammaproteobacteria bacterium]|nr:carboxymuconolactone decarboxylase family protein [Gammaproteobacteria bacterium]
MGWITQTEADTPMEAVLGQRPELLERYRAFYQSFWEDGLIKRRTLELCRLRIAAIHDCAQEWSIRDAQVGLDDIELAALKSGEWSLFSAAEQVALNIAEQIPYQHHQITDEQMNDADRELTTAGAVSLLTACAFFDVNCRLRIVLDVDEQSAELTQAPLQCGALV